MSAASTASRDDVQVLGQELQEDDLKGRSGDVVAVARGSLPRYAVLDFVEAFSWLVQDELDRRRSRLLDRRQPAATLPCRSPPESRLSDA